VRFRRKRRPEPSPAPSPAAQTSAASAPLASGPPPGFGKGIHDYYAHYSDNADAKTGAVLTLGLTVGTLLLSHEPPSGTARQLAWAAAASFAVVVAACLFAIFPRLTSPGRSTVFWEDVQRRRSHEEYLAELHTLTAADVERIYAENNFQVAKVLHRKFQGIRWALAFTALGLALAGLRSRIEMKGPVP
jgi:hypothetical protein